MRGVLTAGVIEVGVAADGEGLTFRMRDELPLRTSDTQAVTPEGDAPKKKRTTTANKTGTTKKKPRKTTKKTSAATKKRAPRTKKDSEKNRD